jgi:hypothetical protein
MTQKAPNEQPTSLHDIKQLCLLDQLLADALRLWALRPLPTQRGARAALSESWIAFREAISDEELAILFPQTKQMHDSLVRHIAV